jgi:hypothetical protein
VVRSRKSPADRDPVFVAAGHRGGRAKVRPAERTRVKIGDLTPRQREAIVAAVEAHRAANRRAETSSLAGVGLTERDDAGDAGGSVR